MSGRAESAFKMRTRSMIDPGTGQQVQIINGNIPQTDPFCFQYGSTLATGNWAGYHTAFTWYSTTGAGGNQPVSLSGADFDPAQYINYGTVASVSVGVGVPWVEGITGLPATGFEPPWGFHNGITSSQPGMFNAVWTDWRATNGQGNAVPNISYTWFVPP